MDYKKIYTVLAWLALASLALGFVNQANITYFPILKNDLEEGFLVDKEKDEEVNMPTFSTKAFTVNAQECYEKDFMAQAQKTGDMSQTTNNFRHEDPSTCYSFFNQ